MFAAIPVIGPFLTALGAGLKLALALFKARNTPAMQSAARAATIAKIHESANAHIAAGDLNAVRRDGSH